MSTRKRNVIVTQRETVEQAIAGPSESVSGSFPFGTLAINGRETLYILVAAGSIGMLIWVTVAWVAQNAVKLEQQTTELTRQHMELSTTGKDSARVISDAMAAQHGEIASVVQGLKDTMDEGNYLATLPPSERMKLNLQMPPSLRDKLLPSHERIAR